MAHTTIADVIVPAVFAQYVQLLSTEKSAYVQSGVVVEDPFFDQFLAGGGQFINMPHWDDLANTEANISGDEKPDLQRPVVINTSDAIPEKITSDETIAIRHNRNQHWSTADLAAQLAGSDPADAIANRVADYWVRQDQRTLNSATQGIIDDNIANDAGDMVVDISTSGGITDVNLIDADAVIDAEQTMGDARGKLRAITVHSVVYTRMQKLQLIDFIPDARGEVDIPFYQGKRVIVDDVITSDLNGANTRYWTLLFGAGAFTHGRGTPKVPAAVSRSELGSSGGGTEVLSSRREFTLHPSGWVFEAASMVGRSPTNAELVDPTNWTRVFERKLVPFAVLQTNG